MSDVMSQHTKGPLKVTPSSSHIYANMNPGGKDGVVCKMASVGLVQWAEGPGTPGNRDNARLLSAAYTSYDKHCGPRAVECAEGDLLGEALKACESFVTAWEKCLQLEKTDVAFRLAKAVIARLTAAGADTEATTVAMDLDF